MDQILSILGSVGFNWHVALANLINFLIILFILNKFFFGKLGKTITNRQKIIERGLTQASEAEKALARAEDEKNKIIGQAKKEGHALVSESQAQAEALAANIKADAEQEISTKLASLEEKEAKLKAKVEKDFAEAAPALVAKLYADSLRKNLTEEENNALIVSLK
jgi:F-type H+-transporting ATPase subunit b